MVPQPPILPLIIFMIMTTLSLVAANPTNGFTTPLPLSNSNFQLHASDKQCYSFSNGLHRFRLYSTNNTAQLYCEIRVSGYDYSSGVWQFQGQFYVTSGTSGVTIQQVFGGATSPTTSQSRVYGGTLTHYQSTPLEQNIYNRWIRFNVIHDVGANNVKIFINGEDNPRYNGPGRGARTHYFKFGLYGQNGASNYMESRWRDIKIFRT